LDHSPHKYMDENRNARVYAPVSNRPLPAARLYLPTVSAEFQAPVGSRERKAGSWEPPEGR
jgi:hypothetical protein